MNDGAGQRLYRRAKELIPGGTGLLSKRPEMFLPDEWPAYYSRCKGAEVWDLDGRRYFDFATMGIGACTLGYGDEDVDAAAMEAIRAGSMCTLNAPEEVELAERLVGLHPWADQVRFARTGGEACAVAVRIARAATGRHKVAFCGYHGWHDWYLAANLGDSSALDGQLLPGLEPAGVPRELRGTALAFNYNRLDELETLVEREAGRIGVIVMEPVRGTKPESGFLPGVRELASREGIVLVFDEVTSGFRMNVGGIHLTMGVEPDIAVFGKALGNGYPISAIVGRAAVMQAAQKTFVSSTYWTERIGFSAALVTLEKMLRLDVPSALVRHGERVMEGWREGAAAAGVGVRISGIPPLAHLTFEAEADDALAMQTLFTQLLLDEGYLAGASVYATLAYTDAIVDGYIAAAARAFAGIAEAVAAGDVRGRLRGGVRHAGFKRLS